MKNKKKSNSFGGVQNKSPSNEMRKYGTVHPKWNLAATVRDYPELIGRRSVKMRWDSVSDTRSRSSTVNSSPAITVTNGSNAWCQGQYHASRSALT